MQPQVYTPGAGQRPQQDSLPGRDEVRGDWQEQLAQMSVSGRRRAADPVFTGLRGAGKTVLLDELCRLGEVSGFQTVWLQSTRKQGIWNELAATLAQRSQDRPEPFWRRALDGLQRVQGVSAAGFGVQFTEPGAGPAAGLGTGYSSGHVAQVLAELGRSIREVEGHGGLVMAVDELQTAPASDVELLAASLHQLNIRYTDAPVLFAGAGLPNTRMAMVGADADHPIVSHPERLFRFREVPAFLEPGAIARALVEPAARHGGSWSGEAVDLVSQVTGGYPAHLQVVAAATWAGAAAPQIEVGDVVAALPQAAQEIEQQYLEPRWSRLSDRQQEYVAALGVAGGEASVRQMQVLLGRGASHLSRVRDDLINRGEIYSPRSRTVALAMPLMNAYAVAAYPEDRARSDLGDELVSLQQMQQNQATWQAGSTAGLAVAGSRIRLAGLPAVASEGPEQRAGEQQLEGGRAGRPQRREGETTHERDQR